MTNVTKSAEFCWDNVVFKVEDTIFCVPRCEFQQTSEVFADMFLLPSGDDQPEGCDVNNPIVLEGYTSEEFSALLKVMYPQGSSLISGTELDFNLTKEEWISVLKLSSIWSMSKIRTYAIYWLSTKGTLTPVQNIQLARAHNIKKWLEEGLLSLVTGVHRLTREEIPTLGWETSAQILWIRDNSSANATRFSMDSITCAPERRTGLEKCSMQKNCGLCKFCYVLVQDHTLSCSCPVSGTNNRLVKLREICCGRCGNPCYKSLYCSSCKSNNLENDLVTLTGVTVATGEASRMIREVFGKEICEVECMDPDAPKFTRAESAE